MNKVFLVQNSRIRFCLVILMDKIRAKNSLIQRLKFHAAAAINRLMQSPAKPLRKFLANRKSAFK